jgi:fatty-acyl-CoA synthase
MTAAADELVPWVEGHTIGSVLRATAGRVPDGDALVFPQLDLRWSWRELDRRVDAAAAGLRRLGVGPGRHVGVWSMNTPEWVVTQFAAGRLGAILVNVNPAYRLYELEEALRTADVETLVVGRPFKASNFVAMVETLCPEVAAASGPGWSAAALPALRHLIALGDRPGPGWRVWSEIDDGGGGEPDRVEPVQPVRPGDLFNMQFTSGTTGAPKGALLTHRNVLLNAYYIGRCVRYAERDRVCIPVPFYHCFGCVLGTLTCAVYGATMVVPAPAFESRATLASVAMERCTSLYGVPTMFVAELGHPDLGRFDLTSLRTGIMAGSPCPMPLMRQVIDVLGMREVTIAYGQTEASPIITMTSADDPIEVRTGTVGRPLPGVEVKLVDASSRATVEPGAPGELCARGHGVMAGYYRNPEATSRAIDSEGWLHTGDLAKELPDGNYRVVGRCKELIIRGGENIYPPEIEEFLLHHPAAAEAAVVGLPDPTYGEVVSAWVVLRPGRTLAPEEMREFCRGRIAHFKIPTHVEIVEQLPRTVTGKVRKNVLREQGIALYGLQAADATPTA